MSDLTYRWDEEFILGPDGFNSHHEDDKVVDELNRLHRKVNDIRFEWFKSRVDTENVRKEMKDQGDLLKRTDLIRGLAVEACRHFLGGRKEESKAKATEATDIQHHVDAIGAALDRMREWALTDEEVEELMR